MKFKKINLKICQKCQSIYDGYDRLLCDYSAVTDFMWRNFFDTKYCLTDNSLNVMQKYGKNNYAFYYPVSENPQKDIKDILAFCDEKRIKAEFCCIKDEYIQYFKDTFPYLKIYTNRNWNDYIYSAEDFKTFAGKKFSGQRNHIHKFQKLYPNYRYVRINKKNISLAFDCLYEFENLYRKAKKSAIYENNQTMELLKNYFKFNLRGGMLIVDNKCVAFSLNEKVGKTLITHVEKVLKNYDGAGPMLVNEIAKDFADDCLYINREDDSGDEGLRISKLQYHPIEIADKNFLTVFKTMQNVNVVPKLHGKKVTVSNFENSDKTDYYNLYVDEDLNKFWGYDYHEDIKNPTPEAFMKMQRKDVKEKTCFSLKVSLKNSTKAIGEVCLYNFDYYGNAEIGIRLFKEYQGYGYAKESLNLVTAWAYKKGVKKIHAKCFKENVASYRLLSNVFSKITNDETYYYFE